ncbi:MAG: MBL fold metallo-hydrolase [Candidatus Margulisiibacteriota bacterium]
MLIYTVVVGELATNCYLAVDPKTAETYCIDPGDDAELIIAAIQKHHLKLVGIINTHAHPDHVEANRAIKQKFKVPIFVHEGDRKMFDGAGLFFSALGYDFEVGYPDFYVTDNKVFTFGDTSLRVIHTPGHSPGGICLYDGQGILFSGDTLFKDGVGRTDLPGGSFTELTNSLKDKLFKLPKNTLVYPGHGESTTLLAEETNLAGEFK